MTVELPQEVVDTIVDYLEGDSGSLKTCSLLSRAWVPRSRFHLFDTFSLDPDNIFAFRDLLRSPSCTFIPHVRGIRAERLHRHPNNVCFTEIAPDLCHLTNVRMLGMRLSIVVNGTNADEFFRTGFVTAFTRVTHLVLSCYSAPHTGESYNYYGEAFYSQPAPLIETLCLFPTLQSLHIVEISGTWADPPANAVPPRGLHSLNLGKNSPGPILAWLHAFNHLPSVDSLKLCAIEEGHLQTVCTALQQVSNAVHLDFAFPKSRWPYDVDPLALFDPSLHPNLRTLLIRDVSGYSGDVSSKITSLVSRLAAPKLESILLEADLWMCAFLNWTALDTFLSLARFPRLRNVTFKRSDKHASHDQVFTLMRAALPLLVFCSG